MALPILPRQRTSLNSGWKFQRWETNPDGLVYEINYDNLDLNDTKVLKPWILPSGNHFIANPAQQHARPDGNPGADVPYVMGLFNDSLWENVTLPHDWAIKGPFYLPEDESVLVDEYGSGPASQLSSTGRLPYTGIGWYRRTLDVPSNIADKTIYLYIQGAMSYSMVWLNGNLVGGWPLGFQPYQLDLTPYLRVGGNNQLAIRCYNPNDSSRFYIGAGLYRDVSLEIVSKVHVSQWGTFIQASNVSIQSAWLDLNVSISNDANATTQAQVTTDIHILNEATGQAGEQVVSFPPASLSLAALTQTMWYGSTTLQNPRLWNPLPKSSVDRYIAITRIRANGTEFDTYNTTFGVRDIEYNADRGLLVNGKHVHISGVNQHSDLGALGSAWNRRAAQRQLEILREMGVNAIRTAHNPPAPELLDLTDEMGFIVMAEIFDQWFQNKTTNDFHYIFQDWHEPDYRAFVRRERNHPSIYIWSIGNEIPEQTTVEGGAFAALYRDIVKSEDPSRGVTASLPAAKPGDSFATALDVESLNYQGEGLGNSPAYQPASAYSPAKNSTFDAFHARYPDKMIESTETTVTLSTRGSFFFPLTTTNGTLFKSDNGAGGLSTYEASDYGLYVGFYGASIDKTFEVHDRHPYVAGLFVWSGFDYLGEPLPYIPYARSSYFGMIDTAGLRKNTFWQYQANWRPEFKMAHILPHWTWPERLGQVTPVHVFTAANEAELFINGVSQGRRTRGQFEYRMRWDNVTYSPGEVHVATYLNGTPWANDTIRTAGEPAQLGIIADRCNLTASGVDLSFLTVSVLDKDGLVVPRANNTVQFSAIGPGEVIATDNGYPADFNPFVSTHRDAFNGLAVGIVRASSEGGYINVTVTAQGLKSATIMLRST